MLWHKRLPYELDFISERPKFHVKSVVIEHAEVVRYGLIRTKIIYRLEHTFSNWNDRAANMANSTGPFPKTNH